MTQKLAAPNPFNFSKGHVDSLLDHAADPRHSHCAPLLSAALNGHSERVKFLLAGGASKAAASSAFMLAARNGHLECLRLLGPKSNISANNSEALLSAAQGGHAECAAFIFRATPASDRLPGILDVAIMLDKAQVVYALLLADRFEPVRVFIDLGERAARAAKRGHFSCASVLASLHELDQAALLADVSPEKKGPRP